MSFIKYMTTLFSIICFNAIIINQATSTSIKEVYDQVDQTETHHHSIHRKDGETPYKFNLSTEYAPYDSYTVNKWSPSIEGIPQPRCITCRKYFRLKRAVADAEELLGICYGNWFGNIWEQIDVLSQEEHLHEEGFSHGREFDLWYSGREFERFPSPEEKKREPLPIPDCKYCRHFLNLKHALSDLIEDSLGALEPPLENTCQYPPAFSDQES